MGAYMEFTVGAILEGKVKSITKFGAFIALPEGKTGLVHISEIAYTYVSEVREYLTEGQEVKVQIIAIDPAGKINLSIKRAQPRPQQSSASRQQSNPRPRPQSAPRQSDSPRPCSDSGAPMMGQVLQTSGDRSFEDKLKAFMSESDSKIADSHQYERKTKSRRR